MSRILVTFLALLCLTGTSTAATVFYSDEAAFVTDSGGTLGYESFESLTATDDFMSDTIQTTDFAITTNNPQANLGIHQNPYLQLHPTDGAKFAGWAAQPAYHDVTFTFTQPVLAFGVMITDALDGGIGSAALLMSTNGGDSITVASGVLASGNEIFAGLIADTPFTSVTFDVTATPAGGDGIGFDEVRFGTPVPAPTALILMTSGVLGLFGVGLHWQRRYFRLVT